MTSGPPGKYLCVPVAGGHLRLSSCSPRRSLLLGRLPLRWKMFSLRLCCQRSSPLRARRVRFLVKLTSTCPVFSQSCHCGASAAGWAPPWDHASMLTHTGLCTHTHTNGERDKKTVFLFPSLGLCLSRNWSCCLHLNRSEVSHYIIISWFALTQRTFVLWPLPLDRLHVAHTFSATAGMFTMNLQLLTFVLVAAPVHFLEWFPSLRSTAS